ncbi:MAG: MmgE/PrpD family protein, partial [Proteobacteria bacterium]|nr:MmgE/PrpD family protein [Pseudomonadota bacterium]
YELISTGGTHQALTGMMEMIEKYETNPDDIESIEHIGPVEPCTGAVLRAEVHEGLEGKFCMAYNIAATIIDRKVDLNTFTNERSDEGDLQEFMKKVKLVHNPDVLLRHDHIADGNPEAKIRIRLYDGTEHEIDLGPAMHLTGDAVVDKFRANAGVVFDQEQMSQPVRIVEHLDELDDISSLMDTVTTGS